MNLKYCKTQLDRMIAYKRIDDMAHELKEKDQQQIVKHANELMHNIFTFDKPWDMERCTIPYQLEIIDWNAQRNDDEEWCFMLNRMDYLNDLILATLITKDDTYLLKGKEWMLDWIHYHPVMKQEPSTRTLDTGIRIMNFIETLPYIYRGGSISDEELVEIMNHIQLQIEYLKAQYLTKYTLSNWGSIQTCAILSILPFYEEDVAKNPIYQWASNELMTQFEIQVYEDGMHWEQSTMYHIEVLNYGMKALYYQRFFGLQEPTILTIQVHRLIDALFYQITPDYQIETFGDSDRVSVKDVFTRAASLFHSSIWKSAGEDVFDSESLYAFGCEFADEYKMLAKETATRLLYDGKDSGMYTMRSSWNKDASFTMFTNGSLGSGHGHSDNLHVSIYHHGVPVWIDPGRYTYREDHPLRVELKTMHAHNTVIVDEKEYCQPSDSWGYHDFGIPCKNYVQHKAGIHYLEGLMIGHTPLQVWIRKLVVIDPDIWMVVDEVKEDGNHHMQASFCIDPAMQASIAKKAVQLHGKTDMIMSGEHPSLKRKECSLRYNECLSHDVVTFSKDFIDETSHITCAFTSSIRVEDVDILQNGTDPLNKTIAEAKKFILSDHESYTIAIFHKEIFKGKKICYCGGMPFHAKCMVVHELHGKKKLIRLRA